MENRLWTRTLIAVVIAVIEIAALTAAQSAPPRIVGYFSSWSVYGRNYHVPNIPAGKVTHINYAFANVVGGKIALGDAYADTDKFYTGDTWAPGALRGSFNRLIQLKKAHPTLKTLISVGGWTWSSGFSDAVLTAASRATFAQSCVDFMVKYGFDGVDVDWEYPVSGGLSSNKTRPADKQNLTLFLADLRSRLDVRGKLDQRYYLLTIAGPANPAIIVNYEMKQVAGYLDWINIMSYDLHGPWGGTLDPVTNFNAPLYASPADPTPQPTQATFNTAAAVKAYIALGVPRAKIGMGLPFYGRGFGGVTGTKDGLYAKYTGPAPVGTWERGVFDYTDLVQNYIGKNGYTSYRHPDARVPWLYNATAGVMIGYDDPRSIREKAWFARAAGIGGVMFWEFSNDRSGALLDSAHQSLHQRPGLESSALDVSVQARSDVALTVRGGVSRAGRTALAAISMSGSFPGQPLPGGVVPLNFDPYTFLSLAQANTPIFSATMGPLDAVGDRSVRLGLSRLPRLPNALIGSYLSVAGWVVGPGGMGEPTNAVDLFFRP